MIVNNKTQKTKAQLVKGFSDVNSESLTYYETVINLLKKLYISYGFETLETPFIEYSDVLGKFLPDQDRPNKGVFSFQDEDERWLSLRYDLTAPLARFVAENFETLPKPYRSLRFGWVFRNEKSGPGRFRQFMQFDADIIGSSDILADFEICRLAADSLKELKLKNNEYVIRINNRKILDSLLDQIGLVGNGFAEQRLIVLRAIDKLDKFEEKDICLLLGEGRLDESGDFTQGAKLSENAIDFILSYLKLENPKNSENYFSKLNSLVKGCPKGEEGVSEILKLQRLLHANGYEENILVDPSVVRGIEYYTGLIFEASLLIEVPNKEGKKIIFGSIGGGGRYDSLISRFRSESIPATGFSIGVSRLIAALQNTEKLVNIPSQAPILVTVMDRDESSLVRYQNLVKYLQDAGIHSELYVGSAGLKAQLKYADRRYSPCVIIQGSQEFENNVVQIKDLEMGRKLSREIKDHSTWKEQRVAQKTVSLDEIIPYIQKILNKKYL